MNDLIKKVFILCVVLIIALVIGTAVVIVVNDRNNDLHAFEEGVCYGFIRGYIEPDECDDMYVYIVLDDRSFVTELSMYAIPKDVYKSFDEKLKQVIDNREIGYLIEAVTAYNEHEFNRLGYLYIKSVRRYDNSAESEHKVQEREYNW